MTLDEIAKDYLKLSLGALGTATVATALAHPASLCALGCIGGGALIVANVNMITSRLAGQSEDSIVGIIALSAMTVLGLSIAYYQSALIACCVAYASAYIASACVLFVPTVLMVGLIAESIRQCIDRCEGQGTCSQKAPAIMSAATAGGLSLYIFAPLIDGVAVAGYLCPAAISGAYAGANAMLVASIGLPILPLAAIVCMVGAVMYATVSASRETPTATGMPL